MRRLRTWKIWCLWSAGLVLVGGQPVAVAAAEENQAQPEEVVVRGESGRRDATPRSVAGQLIVKYTDSVTECVHCLLRTKQPFKHATTDASDSLDALHAKYHVRAARPLFRTELEDERLRGGAPRVSLAALKRHHDSTLRGVQATFPQRTQRAPVGAGAPDVAHVYVLELPEGTDLEDAVAEFQRDPHVAYAHPNLVFEPDLAPNDPAFPSQYAHTMTDASLAWDLQHDAPNIVVALIGTGVRYTHPDLAANIWSNPGESDGNGIDDDGNGFVDDVRGWDFAAQDNDPMDTQGHETSVAGVAGAVGNNGRDIAGISWRVSLMPLRIDYATDQVVAALQYAYANGADIVNMSFGSYDLAKYGPQSAVKDLILTGVANGVLLVATAGNDDISTKRYPGAYEEVIGVASTDATDRRSGFSNWGDWVDVAAPGSSVLSTNLSDGYSAVSGTSFAAPYVAGLGALLFSRFPSLTLPDARLRLEYTVEKLQTDKPIGSGRINASRAILSDARPGPFAVIKRPWNDFVLPETGLQEIWGTALGDAYVVEYQPEGAATWTPIGSGGETVNGTLAQLDVSALPPDASYNIRLRITKGAQEDSHTVTVARGGGYQAGWPVQLGGGAIVCPAVAADVDGDGDLELVVGTNSGKVFVVHHTGQVAAGWPQPLSPAFVYGAPAIGDIDGDGDVEIVATSFGYSAVGVGLVGAWHHTGALVAGWPQVVGQLRGAAALADLDGDPALEIVAVSTSAAAGGPGHVHVWNGDGSRLPGWPYTLPQSNVQTAPAIGDVDNDGTPELVIATYSWLVLLRPDGSLFASWQRSGSHTHPVLMDRDGDGDLEIGTMYNQSTVYVYTHSGTQLFSRSVGPDAYAQVSTGDLGLDPGPEFLFAGPPAAGSGLTTEGSVYVWNAANTLVAGWPQGAVGKIQAEPTIGDVDGNGVADIVVGTQQGRVYAWNRNGVLLPGFPKRTASEIYAAVTIQDLDGDGDTELVAGTGDGTIFVWDLAGPYVANRQPWPFSRHDAQNTGRLPGNRRPVLDPVGNKTINENQPLTLSISASDPEGDSMAYSASPLPPGASFDETTQTFSWTPDFTQAGSYNVTFSATDGTWSDSERITITVLNANQAPVLAPIGNKTVIEGQLLSFTVSASDPDGVNTLLTYSAAPLPAGAGFWPVTGTFSWRPSLTQAGTYQVTFTVSDGSLTDEETITITVFDDTAPPTVAITNPQDGTTVPRNTTVTIWVSASDDVGVTKVEFWVNGSVKYTDATTPYTCAWKVPGKAGASYSLIAKAYDAAGNTGSHTIRVTSR